MTPGIHEAKQAKIAYTIHEYAHDPSCESYGVEAASRLGVSENRVFKTLVVEYGSNQFAVGVIPVSSLLNMKLIAKAIGAKKASMATAIDVERVTGYVLGGVSPIGQKKRLKTVIDSSAIEHQTIYVSAGRRGLEIELKPQDLALLTNAKIESISK